MPLDLLNFEQMFSLPQLLNLYQCYVTKVYFPSYITFIFEDYGQYPVPLHPSILVSSWTSIDLLAAHVTAHGSLCLTRVREDLWGVSKISFVTCAEPKVTLNGGVTLDNVFVPKVQRFGGQNDDILLPDAQLPLITVNIIWYSRAEIVTRSIVVAFYKLGTPGAFIRLLLMGTYASPFLVPLEYFFYFVDKCFRTTNKDDLK